MPEHVHRCVCALVTHWANFLVCLDARFARRACANPVASLACPAALGALAFDIRAGAEQVLDCVDELNHGVCPFMTTTIPLYL